MMPLDPKAQALLDADHALGLPEKKTLTPAEARSQKNARPPAPQEPVYQIEERQAAGPAGPVPVRIYRPSPTSPLPALAFFHGGGWVQGSVDQTDPICRTLANAAGCIVASVDYRLAPEAKFPAAAEDCYAATRWLAENAAELGVDRARIAAGGLSAGGNLAAVVALMARDRGGPPLVLQVLGYPITDYNFETPSYLENADGFGLSRDDMIWYWRHYLPEGADGLHPYASPLRAADLSGVAPALVITAEFDPLRDEAEAYAARLRAAGVEVTCTRYVGMIHGFFTLPHLLDQAQQAVGQVGAALRSTFASEAAPAGG
jgi:acetyl esterase